jgi:hypothetical protein
MSLLFFSSFQSKRKVVKKRFIELEKIFYNFILKVSFFAVTRTTFFIPGFAVMPIYILKIVQDFFIPIFLKI